LNECRNCGENSLEDLGAIGKVAPFFLKRVFGMELRYPRSPSPMKQKIRALAESALSLLSRFSVQNAFVEIQLCRRCFFIQTRIPFHQNDIMRLYLDYRSPSYNRERILYEPSYASIAESVGQHRIEIQSRTAALKDFLNRNLTTNHAFTILDYGGSDGKFIPDFPGNKFVYEISDIDPISGVTRIESESDLGQYSLVLLAHVIEHVTHPLDLVRKVASYVEPGGYLYIETPQEITDNDRNRFLHGASPFDITIHEHINSYCKPAVTGLLESAGFNIIAVEAGQVDAGWAQAVHIRALGRKRLLE